MKAGFKNFKNKAPPAQSRMQSASRAIKDALDAHHSFFLTTRPQFFHVIICYKMYRTAPFALPRVLAPRSIKFYAMLLLLLPSQRLRLPAPHTYPCSNSTLHLPQRPTLPTPLRLPLLHARAQVVIWDEHESCMHR
jgi:hypothetical protein